MHIKFYVRAGIRLLVCMTIVAQADRVAGYACTQVFVIGILRSVDAASRDHTPIRITQ